MAMTVKLEGTKDVIKNLNKYRDKAKKARLKTIKKTARLVTMTARNNIGRGGQFPSSRTGELKSLIKWKIDGHGEGYTVAHVGVLDDATKEQAIKANSVEYGHALPGGGKDSKVRNPIKHVPAHPFLRPAKDKHKKTIKKIYYDDLKGAFK